MRAARWMSAVAGLAAAIVLGLAACGGTAAPKLGDCIDGQSNVVDCSSAAAKQRLVSNQDAANAIACVQIGDKPQKEVTVGGHHYCAEPVR